MRICLFVAPTRPGVDKVKPKGWFKYSLQIDQGVVWDCSTFPPCPCLHGRPTFGPSYTEFVSPELKSKIDA